MPEFLIIENLQDIIDSIELIVIRFTGINTADDFVKSPEGVLIFVKTKSRHCKKQCSKFIVTKQGFDSLAVDISVFSAERGQLFPAIRAGKKYLVNPVNPTCPME